MRLWPDPDLITDYRRHGAYCGYGREVGRALSPRGYVVKPATKRRWDQRHGQLRDWQQPVRYRLRLRPVFWVGCLLASLLAGVLFGLLVALFLRLVAVACGPERLCRGFEI